MSKTNVGCHWQPEITVSKDPVSGATVHQMTHYKGHSSHFYFTYPCWYDNGSKIVIFSDREGRTNLFGVDLASGEMTQLTAPACPPHDERGHSTPMTRSLHPKGL